jgi:hypothetical protein
MVNEPNRRIGASRALRIAICLSAFAAAFGLSQAAVAQNPPDSGGKQPSEGDLAKASQNPIANLVTVPLQYNYFTAGGLGENTALQLNVQPVLPLPMGKRWLMISRTIVPFVSIPAARLIPNTNLVDSISTSGTADIQQQVYFVPTKPAKITWGLGPIFSLPTASNRLARTGQWGLGPTGVVVLQPSNWVIGVVTNNIWRIGGDARGHVLNSFLVQPFINYNLPFAWYIASAPIITADWSAPPGEKWTVPIGLGAGKVTHIGTQAMNFGIQYYHNLNHPTPAGAEQVRFEAALLWPTAAAAAKAKAAKKGDDQNDQSP